MTEAEEAASYPGYLEGWIACDDPVFIMPDYVADALSQWEEPEEFVCV